MVYHFANYESGAIKKLGEKYKKSKGLERFVEDFSDSKLVEGLTELATGIQLDLPFGAIKAFSETDVKLLYPLLRRAFRLSCSLPNEPLNEFRKETQELARSTEAERRVIQRVG